jgi:serine O-acetyltransferase
MLYRSLVKDHARYGGRNANPLAMLLSAMRDAGFRAVALYRVGRWCRGRGLRLPAAVIERVMHHLCHCWISTAAEIGDGFMIAHVGGLVIGGGTIIGTNCDVRQNVTFGGNFNRGDVRKKPIIGDNVSVGVGAVILGPVRVGSNSIIGANSVVTRDVPANVIVSGIPAGILKPRWDSAAKRRL